MSFDINILIGAQLINFDDEGFTVIKDGKTFSFEYYCYEGDCSSYIEIETELYVNLSDTSNNPVITKVEGLPCNDPGQCCDITLYGLYKPMAKAFISADIDSGYGYGACVQLHCNQTNEPVELVSY